MMFIDAFPETGTKYESWYLSELFLVDPRMLCVFSLLSLKVKQCAKDHLR